MTAESHQLHKISVLKSLTPRAAPYWAAPIARGRFVGYRKISADKGTWIARMRGLDDKQKYQSLGWATEAFDFDHAKAALIDDPTTKAREISVTTNHGVVRLTGTVGSMDEKMEAARVAATIDGVKDVRNHLEVKTM